MEASVAASDGAADAAEPQEQASSLDLSPVLERFEDLGGRMERMEQQFSRFGEPEGQEEEPADDFADFDLDGMDPQQAQQVLQQIVDARLQEALGQHIQPLSEQVRGIQVGLDADALVARYPELGKQEIAKPVVEAARAFAQEAGDESLATNTKVLELIYKAQMADKRAAGEVPAGGEQQFDLERGSGAGPAAADEPNIAERIVKARQNDEFWRF